MKKKNRAWAVKSGGEIWMASLRETEEEVVKWLRQYSSHVASMSGAYKIVKVKLVEVEK